MHNSCSWIFDLPPASGARSGGDASELAFRPEIDTFVREVLQNTMDHRRKDIKEPAIVNFRLTELEAQNTEAFLDSISWDELRPHIEAAGEHKRGKSFISGLEKLDKTGSLLILTVEDNNISGLLGPEYGEEDSDTDKNYTSLCKDKLFSEKPSNTSGGSYGMGKAVLWRFSEFSTVFFNSNLFPKQKGKDNPRFVGRSSLPWHKCKNGKSYAGDGWFGKEVSSNGLKRAESIWGNHAGRIAKNLYIGRNPEFSGTSILIIGFNEPAAEDRSVDEVARAIKDAAALSFWPSITGSPEKLIVNVETYKGKKKISSEQVTFAENVIPFNTAYIDYISGKTVSELKKPGDTVSVPVSIEIPARKDGKFDAMKVEATLLIRLSEFDDDSDDELRNHLAIFRGPGMVIKYIPFKALSLTAKPFHAVLLCGKARYPGDTPEDEALELFLRDSEPPEHNDWTTTENLKDNYNRGYKKALDMLFAEVRKILRQKVSISDIKGSEGPSLLMRKFPLGPVGGGKSKQPFHYRNLTASLNKNGEWAFKGRVICSETADSGWKSKIDLQFSAESGNGAGNTIKSLKAEAGKVALKDGIAYVELDNNIKEFSFEGITDKNRHPIDSNMATIDIVISSKKN